MNWTIRKKVQFILLSSLIGMVIIGLFLGGTTFYQRSLNHRVNEIADAASIVQNIHALMEGARKDDQSYINHPSAQGAGRVRSDIANIHKEITRLKQADVAIGTEIKSIQKAVDQYEANFKNLQAIREQIGYSGGDGLLQSVAESEKSLTDLIRSTKDGELIAEMQKVHVAINDFTHEPKETYYNAVTGALDHLDDLGSSKFSGNDADDFGHAMLKLKSSMDTINRSEQLAAQIESDFNKNAQAVSGDVNKAAEKLDKQKNGLFKTQSVVQITLFIVTIVLIIAVIAGLYWFGRKLISGLNESIRVLKNGARHLEKGDLKHRVPLIGNDELTELAKAFNQMAETMEVTLNKVTEAADSLSSSSQNLAAVAQETNAQALEVNEAVQQVAVGAQNQAEHLEESMALLSNVSRAIDETSVHSNEIDEQSQEAQRVNAEGVRVVKVLEESSARFLDIAKQLITNIQEVADQSKKITSIVKIIRDISSNTDLLALNAAIESARAGEAGRGFAVVSHEIRKLAERSKKETKNIQDVIGVIIGRLNDIAEEANKLNEYCNEQDRNVKQTKAAFKDINENVSAISDKIAGIKEAIANVKQANADLSTKLEEISAIAEETAASTEQVSASSESQTAAIESVNEAAIKLQEIAVSLEKEVAKFEIAKTSAERPEGNGPDGLAGEPADKAADAGQPAEDENDPSHPDEGQASAAAAVEQADALNGETAEAEKPAGEGEEKPVAGDEEKRGEEADAAETVEASDKAENTGDLPGEAPGDARANKE
ncbi:methyl-accepting chemotaxis protein [Caenibacillus caldisaponilyticus]|uniref:methyl-accepting chemotaxis protein n=1 Tax=Caenibacillus caldisaponilyticus TaxID=1674942 RepID=UPI0009886341|nr:methyl-accepting chemotaxis protein [Caenibacillus caldisaponilyticus]